MLSCIQLFCDPMDCSPLGCSVHGIFQARLLEWVAISSSRDLPDPGIDPVSPGLQADSLPAEPWVSKGPGVAREGGCGEEERQGTWNTDASILPGPVVIEVASLGALCLRASTPGARCAGLSAGKCRLRAHGNHTDPQITAARE